jgi:phospholipid/cholesterol/gamma-HCH transport system substrate-binding protein
MSREAKVGLTLALAGFLLVLGIFLVGDEEGIWQSKYELRIIYDNVHGLMEGAPVRLVGLRVGSVKKIGFAEEYPGKLEVTIKVDNAVKKKIRTDSEAMIGTMGLLGDKTIEISIGSPDLAVIEEGGLVRAGQVASIEAIIAESGDIVENIKETSQHAKEIIEKINTGTGSLGLFVNDPNVYFDLDKLLLMTEKLTAQLESGEGSFARLVTDSTFYVELTRFFTTTGDLLDSLTTGEGTLPKLMNDPGPFEDIRTIVADWRTITDQLKAGEGSAGRLLMDDSLYINMSRTLERTEALLVDFRNNPHRYVKFSIF